MDSTEPPLAPQDTTTVKETPPSMPTAEEANQKRQQELLLLAATTLGGLYTAMNSDSTLVKIGGIGSALFAAYKVHQQMTAGGRKNGKSRRRRRKNETGRLGMKSKTASH